jgi:hypothetical protein
LFGFPIPSPRAFFERGLFILLNNNGSVNRARAMPAQALIHFWSQ